MRKLISDFDFTVWLPLAIVVLVFLGISVGRYFAAIFRLRRAAKWRRELAGTERDTEQGRAEFAEWRKDQEQGRRKGMLSVLLSAIAAALLSGFLFMSDRSKLDIMHLVWSALGFLSSLSFVGGLIASCVYAYKRERLICALSLVLMLLAAASTEHFMHQRENTGHVLCPNCDDSDSNN